MNKAKLEKLLMRVAQTAQAFDEKIEFVDIEPDSILLATKTRHYVIKMKNGEPIGGTQIKLVPDTNRD